MQYPQLKQGTTKTLQITALSGGCNRRDGNRCTPDNQLVEAENLWWQDGALRTRPGLRVHPEQKETFTGCRISWKFCNEDTTSDFMGEAVRGRRFLRRIYNIAQEEVTLQTGILTYDGQMTLEGEMDGFGSNVTGMLMEYPYTATENVIIFVSTGSIYAQNSVTHAWRQIDGEAYVPCIQIGATGVQNLWDMPTSTGISYEGRNMLTGKFSAKYTTTSGGFAFHMPLKELDEDQPVEIEIAYNDGGIVSYTVPAGQTECGYGSNGLKPHVDRQKGIFYFLSQDGGVTAPLPGFTNNMTMTASKSWSAAEKKRIATMQFSTWFGGSQAGGASRQFISGSPQASSRIYWSGEGQPLYFPETNYITVGDINQAITAFGKQDGMLVIFKEREMYGLSGPDGTVAADKVDGSLMQEVTATTEYFPLKQLHGQIGCPAPQSICLCGNRLVWADGSGSVYTLIRGTADTGCTVRELSSLIAPELRQYSAAQWKTASAGVLRGYYLLLVKHTVYALRIDEKAFNRYATTYDDTAAQQRLAWYIWQLPETVTYTALCGNGQAAVALAEEKTFVTDILIPVYLDALPDMVPQNDSWQERPVRSKLCTKAYDFGNSCSRKRILRVRVGMETGDGATAGFSYMCDTTVTGDAVMLRDSPMNGIFSLTPNCTRVQRFGFAMQGEGTVAVDSLAVTYRC